MLVSTRWAGAEAGSKTVRGAASLLAPIKRAKYPALTEEGQISLPLQTLHLAVFDAILVRMLNQLTSRRRGTSCASMFALP